MSKTDKNKQVDTTVKNVRLIPENLPEELLPLFDWWHEKGKQTVISVVIGIAIVAAGWFYHHHLRAKQALTSEQLLAAHSTEELESLVNAAGVGKNSYLPKIALAKAYYDDGRYDDALALYDVLAKKKGHPFVEVAVLGRAQTLEAKGDINAAKEAFANFRANNPESYLTPLAFMGEARCLAMQGDKAGAATLLDLLIAAKTDTPWEDIAANHKQIVANYEKRAPTSLFDQADLLALPPAAPTPELPRPEIGAPAVNSDQTSTPAVAPDAASVGAAVAEAPPVEEAAPLGFID